MQPLIARKTAVGVVPNALSEDEDDESSSHSYRLNWREKEFRLLQFRRAFVSDSCLEFEKGNRTLSCSPAKE